MNDLQQIPNHEIWITCQVCGCEYDVRLEVCDTCQKQ